MREGGSRDIGGRVWGVVCEPFLEGWCDVGVVVISGERDGEGGLRLGGSSCIRGGLDGSFGVVDGL